MSLLDELLRQTGINRDEYAQLHNKLEESLRERDDDDDEEEMDVNAEEIGAEADDEVDEVTDPSKQFFSDFQIFRF